MQNQKTNQRRNTFTSLDSFEKPVIQRSNSFPRTNKLKKSYHCVGCDIPIDYKKKYFQYWEEQTRKKNV